MPVRKGRLETTPENLLALYESMVRIRLFEDVAMERYKQGVSRLHAPLSGRGSGCGGRMRGAE
jgi:TPP-dependent pyruvate/acetoin dehydrogenase alpha subunit